MDITQQVRFYRVVPEGRHTTTIGGKYGYAVDSRSGERGAIPFVYTVDSDSDGTYICLYEAITVDGSERHGAYGKGPYVCGRYPAAMLPESERSELS